MTNSLLLYSFSHFGLIVLLHQFLFSKHENLHVQRLFLLIATSLGVIIPFISWNSIQTVSQWTEFVVIASPIKSIPSTREVASEINIISLIYFSRVIVSLMKIVISYFGAFQLIKKFPINKKNQWITYRVTQDNISSFSFWNQICLNPNDIQSNEIEIHETTHVRQWHSLDKLVFDTFKVVFWFNPFIYWLEKQVAITHELLADDSVLLQKVERSKYAQKIMQSVLGVPTPYPVNPFFKTNGLQKRIQFILNNNPYINKTLMKYTPIVTSAVLAVSIFAAACTQQSLNLTEEFDSPAQLKTAEYSGLGEYLGSNIKYPESAKKDSAEGKVFIEFIVSKDGSIINPIVVKSSYNAALDAEALRVVKSMPNMIPANKDGEPVNTKFVLPVSFKLKAEKTNTLGFKDGKKYEFQVRLPLENNDKTTTKLENGVLYSSGFQLVPIIKIQPNDNDC